MVKGNWGGKGVVRGWLWDGEGGGYGMVKGDEGGGGSTVWSRVCLRGGPRGCSRVWSERWSKIGEK